MAYFALAKCPRLCHFRKIQFSYLCWC